MLHSGKFEVTITGTHSVLIPIKEVKPFLDNGHSRVALKAYFKNKEITFHGKLHKRNETVLISFGKRYQKELGVMASDFFQLQILEDTTKYGVEMPQELSAVLETDDEALERFRKLTAGKKRSLIYFILRFKNIQTRVDRALIICENLRRGATDLKLLVKSRR